MNVREMIAALSKLPQDVPVVVWSDNREAYFDAEVGAETCPVHNVDDRGLVDSSPHLVEDLVSEGKDAEPMQVVVLSICD